MAQTQIYSSGPFKTFRMPGPLAAQIKTDFPEVELGGRLEYAGKTIRYEDRKFNERIIFGDIDLFSIFSINFIQGKVDKVFSDFNSIVISDKMAKKYFDTENPIGKVMFLNDTKSFKVTGVYEEIPQNSTVRFDFCIPFEHIKDDGYNIDRYGNNSLYTWVLLSKNSSEDDFNSKLKGYYQKVAVDSKSDVTFWIWPLSKAHLYSILGGGLINTIVIFLIVAAFILIIACINFMNLSTARSSLRSKEIGLRKVLGAIRTNIISQFMGESGFITLLSVCLACIIVIIVLPTFNHITNKELEFSLLDPLIISSLIILTILTSIIAGSYPAIYLSSFKPIAVLKGSLNKGRSGILFRRILVVFQFTLSIGLIIGTIIIQKQLSYIQTKEIGIDKEKVVILRIKKEANQKFDALKASLLQNPIISFVSRSGELPINIGSNSGGFSWEGKEESQNTPIGFLTADVDFEKTNGLKMVYGRFFSKEFGTDSSAVVINESAAKLMGKENPVGDWFDWGTGNRYHIIGVVKDFNYQNLSHNIEPLAIFSFTTRSNFAMIKLAGSDNNESINYIEECWNNILPTFPFEYSYMTDDYNAMYERETSSNTMFKYFAMLAIIISCLGLFGLASYMAEQKTKEIGIRKAVGASIASILYVMSKEFAKLILLANLISWPLAWYFGKQFLEQYANRATLSLDIFILAGMGSILIAFLTISYQSVKAAKSNPVEALRYE